MQHCLILACEWVLINLGLKTDFVQGSGCLNSASLDRKLVSSVQPFFLALVASLPIPDLKMNSIQQWHQICSLEKNYCQKMIVITVVLATGHVLRFID
jgi:hypothetical protein